MPAGIGYGKKGSVVDGVLDFIFGKTKKKKKTKPGAVDDNARQRIIKRKKDLEDAAG
jgi:hypothetical protein